MGIFISVPKTAECIVISLMFAAMLCFALFRQAGVLQSSGYSCAKYFKWVKKKGNTAFKRFALLAMLCALLSAVVSLCFSFCGEWAAVVGLVPFIIFFVTYLCAEKRGTLRSEAAFTFRFFRLYAVLFFISAVVSYILVTLLNFADYVWGNYVFTYLRYCALSVLPLIAIPLLMLSNAAAKIYELPHNKKFIRRAKAKLAASGIKVIAITGSYGKTSVKFILNEMLSRKFRVLTTPRSHNTPIGIALAVNNANLDDYDIFIAEMGARHMGDVAELCEICPPDISIITGICGQHLETFGTFANIIKAKGEILSYTKDVAVIADDCYDYFAEYPIKKVRASCVSDILADCDGTSFTLTINGESVKAHTKLLGEHSAYNIGIAAVAASLAGMDVNEICAAANGLEYIEHRLQLIQANGVNILDDGYNSNVKGARAALEALKKFGGKKIVVTPGLVELGVLEESENYELGKHLVGFDYVILVGETLILPVRRGYVDGGGDTAKIMLTPSLSKAKEELQKVISQGDAVLFLNDLPDIY